MNTTNKPHRLAFTGKQQVCLEPFELPDISTSQVRVRIECSLMSTGTENIVFNRYFETDTHWDRWVKYPFYPGYSAVGIVEAVGPGDVSFKIGDRVACRTQHCSQSVVDTTRCLLVPDGIGTEEAVWFALAKIAFHGSLAANYSLGDSVLIIGAGPIGQMSVRWAHAAGVAAILVADMVDGRLEIARQGGASAVISTPIAEAKEAVMTANNGKLPRVVIDSTGNAAVFSAALELADKFGTIVLLGDTGQPSQQSLSSDVLMRGLRVVGAHDSHNSEQWNAASIGHLFFRMAASGRFRLEGLTSHRFNPEDCAAAYGVANSDRASTMGILFQWS